MLKAIILIVYALIPVGLEAYFMTQMYKNARNKDLCAVITDAVMILVLFIGLWMKWNY